MNYSLQVCVWVCVCVCVWLCVCMRERERERDIKCVCVWGRTNIYRERHNICLCVFMREGRKEREWMRVCMCACECVCVLVGGCVWGTELCLSKICTGCNFKPNTEKTNLTFSYFSLENWPDLDIREALNQCLANIGKICFHHMFMYTFRYKNTKGFVGALPSSQNIS